MSITTPVEPDSVVQRHREAFVRNVRVIMARDGLKARHLADRTGRAYPYVWARITGRVVPDLDDLATLADALGVTAADLVSVDEPTTSFIPGSAS